MGLEPHPAPPRPFPTDRPPVSVVVVNWNGITYLPDCLGSIARQSYPSLEIIVVDNGSTDGSVALLRAAYGSRIHLIESPTNLGFAGGTNVGIRAAKGAYLALLNNDAVADAGWIDALIRAAEADPRVGMCASKIYVRGQDGVLDSAGLLLSRDGIGRGRGRLERDDGRFSHEEEALVPSGCAALYRRAMLDEIGLFDEDFFAYCEDTDLGLRGRLAGWTCRYVPDAVVFHKYSGSSAPYSPFKAFQVERNRIWVVVKCFPPGLIVASVGYTLARYLVQAYGALSGRGAAAGLAGQTSVWSMVAILLRAYRAAFARLPEMWRRRRQVQALGKVTPRQVRRWFQTHHLGLRELALKD
ncbi:MAG: glycosyl transferase family protein [Candidatus Rokubacteria bacterium CSP1-6]|nr:MAG: glycosyl transferase family protein [Candidatus Rokubacteria bacterium CSP1-6]